MQNQLDLNVILDFLVDNNHTQNFNYKKKVNTEKINLDYLENYNSINFKYFNEFFNNHVDRIGIHEHFKSFNSLYYCLLFIMYSEFNFLDLDQQIYLIKTVKSKIKDDIINRKVKLPNRFKKIALSKLKDNNNNYNDIFLLSIFFNVNIFLFCYDKKKIISFYEDDKINIYKKNIFLNRINNVYYPLIYKNNNGYFFNYNSTILNNVIFNDKIISYHYKNKKDFIISNSWEELLDKYLKIDTSNIIFDININKNLYDSDSDSPVNIDNLTEELQKVNDKLENIDSDDLNLSDSINNSNLEDENNINSDDIELSDNENDTNLDLINEIKLLSTNKLKKIKKAVLVNYLSLIINESENEIKKLNKDKIIENLESEINKFI